MITYLLPAAAILCLLLAALSLMAARGARARAGIPQGRIVYSDVGTEQQPSKALVSQRYRLAGKPDYIVSTADGDVPVECKSTRAPARGPYESHVAQAMAYCLLMEDLSGVAPPYGLIKYSDRTVRVRYTPEMKRRLLGLIEEVYEARGVAAAAVHRNHSAPARCRSCGVREACGEAL